MIIDTYGIIEININEPILNDESRHGLHWIEFLSYFLPMLAIILAYSADDSFRKYNKFPEQVTRISVFQFKEKRIGALRYDNGVLAPDCEDGDLIGLRYKRTQNFDEEELALAEKHIKDDDSELLNRYRSSAIDKSTDSLD